MTQIVLWVLATFLQAIILAWLLSQISMVDQVERRVQSLVATNKATAEELRIWGVIE